MENFTAIKTLFMNFGNLSVAYAHKIDYLLKNGNMDKVINLKVIFSFILL